MRCDVGRSRAIGWGFKSIGADMESLPDGLIMRILDGLACALLAAAAAARARNLGAHVTGAVVLGCLCGLMGPLLREVFLHGTAGTGYIAREFPDEALVGSLGALAALYIMPSRSFGIYYWLDASGMALGSCAGALLSVPELGLVGALTLGLLNGLAPGLIRDMALGDTAMLVDREWYATAAALGAIIALGLFLAFHIWQINEWLVKYPEVGAVLGGFGCVMGIRFWRWRKPEEQ